jgi:hypothetical protein
MRPLALFHLWAGLGFFAALIWTYTVSHNEIAWYLGTSGSRTVTGLLVIATSAIVHLAGRDDRTAETAT